jgi:hypothetical protein
MRAHTPAATLARDAPPKRPPNRQQPLTLDQMPQGGFQRARPKLDQARRCRLRRTR